MRRDRDVQRGASSVENFELDLERLRCVDDCWSDAQQIDSKSLDAIFGVEAGKKGEFGVVLGVDRHNRGDLKQHGADWVISDFTQITGNQFIESFTSMTRAA
jgi:hypothetical protein